MLLRSKRATVPAIAIALTLLAGGNALAHVDGYSRLHDDGAIDSAKETHGHDQHGGIEGHLPAGSSNVSLVSKLALKNVVEGKIADVGVHNGYAYLAAWGGQTCKYNGVHVVDIRNVAAPREVAFIQAKEGSYPGEGVQAVRITTPYFNGDILVTNNETCKGKQVGFGGMNAYDVTNPAHPTPLFEGFGDETLPGLRKKAANEIHSVFAWDAGSKAYAVIVDNEEAADVDIIDITNPKKPKFVAEHNLAAKFPQILQASPSNLTEVFHHDMVVKEINAHFYMLISYWDGGYVVLNVDDPANPTYVSDSDFTNPDPEAAESGLTVKPEGNAHQSEFSKDNDFIVAADEDFSPYALTARNVTDGTEFAASLGSDTPGIEPGDTLAGHTMFIGRACNGDPGLQAPPAADGWIAVVERGLCTFTEKVANVEASGAWDAVIVMNREGDDACNVVQGMSVAGNIPAIAVSRPTGFDLFDTPYDDAACKDATQTQAPIAFGTVGDDVEIESEFDGWGYVHLYSNNAGKLTELDTYAVPEAHDPAYAEGFGDLSVHEVAMSHQRNELAYFSYYAAGFRVAAIEGGELVEKGFYIDEGGNNFWGVQVFNSGGQEYVAASDRDFGLYIFKYNG